MGVNRLAGKHLLPEPQGHTRIALAAVPEGVIVLPLDDVRNLDQLGLELLQADDVGALALEPFLNLRDARANTVDIPGGDLHYRSSPRILIRARQPVKPVGLTGSQAGLVAPPCDARDRGRENAG